MKKKPHIIVILGPTAIGKTKVAIEVARHFNGEIVSADSRQIYKYLDIGTAKPTQAETSEIPHHLIDIIEPGTFFSAWDYKLKAHEAISKVINNNKLPIITGGTGFYIRSLCNELEINDAPPNLELREKLKKEAKEDNGMELYKKLQLKNPSKALKIHPNDTLRVIRALEIEEFSYLTKDKENITIPDYSFIKIGLTMNRENLYLKIEKRIDYMLEAGLIDEVKNLILKGYKQTLLNMKIIGYCEMIDYIENTSKLEEAINLFKQHTKNYAKRQLTWFKKEKNVKWFNVDEISNINLITKTSKEQRLPRFARPPRRNNSEVLATNKITDLYQSNQTLLTTKIINYIQKEINP